MSGRTDLRIGVIGASRIAPSALLRPAVALPGVSVQAVAARSGQRAADFARRHAIPRSYGSYDALLADPAIDAVYIATPAALHAEWMSRALSAGKHVLCEGRIGEPREVRSTFCVLIPSGRDIRWQPERRLFEASFRVVGRAGVLSLRMPFHPHQGGRIALRDSSDHRLVEKASSRSSYFTIQVIDAGRRLASAARKRGTP